MSIALRMLLVVIAIGSDVLSAAAQDTKPPVSTSPATAVEATKPLTPEEKERRRKAQIAMSALGGILIVGVAGIAAIMLWARRLRRIARGSSNPQALKNELWFLKPEKPPVRSALPGTQPPPTTGSDS